MSRSPKINELPRYGSVWSWDDNAPLMAIAETPSYTLYGTTPVGGVPKSWMFMRIVDEHGEQGNLISMWWTAGDEVMGEWELLDE